MRSIAFLAVAALVMIVLFVLIDVMSVSKTSYIPSDELRLQTEFAATWLFRIAGGFIAIVAALALLIRSLDREPLTTLLPFVLPLLGGTLLAASHWSVAIALSIVFVGLIGKEIAGSLPTGRSTL